MDSEADRVRIELHSVTADGESYRRERDLAKQDLGEKERVLADMSLRLDVLVRKADSGGNTISASQIQGADQKLVQHINTLHEQLYTERRENRRLKGAYQYWSRLPVLAVCGASVLTRIKTTRTALLAACITTRLASRSQGQSGNGPR
jgi:hypothetical protein